MSISKANFIKVKLLFTELVSLDLSSQDKRIKELMESGQINNQQVDLLKNMLKADQATDLITDAFAIANQIKSDEDFKQTIEIVGQQLGPYKIIKPIGSGGMGHVFLAERNDGEFQQQVAIKLSHSHLSQDLAKRFETERQVLADLNHPHIARLLDGGTSQSGQPFLVMEYIDGQRIDQYCVQNQPSLSSRIKLIIQACSAITLAHQQLILHRDLKPENIMVNNQDEVKIIDFGIAKLLEKVDHQKQTATQIMTRYYASPEQIKGQHVSTQSDLFSLAVIAYELITGCHPFHNNDSKQNQHEREKNVLSGEILRITNRNDISEPLLPELTQIPESKIKGDLENILIKALSAETDQRYNSVEAFADDLKNFLEHKPVSARKPSALYSLGKLIQRQKFAAGALVIALLSLLIATGVSIWQANEALKQQKLAEQQRQLAELESEKAIHIADFVKSMLKNAKPQSNEKQLTAQDLLMQGFIDAQNETFVHQETKFELLALMHQGLRSLGKYQESLDVIQQHYDECTQNVGSMSRSCQTLLMEKANIETSLDFDEEALKTIAIAEAVSLSREPIDREELFDFYAIKNTALIHLDRFDEARSLQLKTFEMEKKATQPNPQRLVQLLHNMALSQMLDKQYQKARIYMDQIPAYLETFDPADLPLWLGSNYGLEAYYYSSIYQAEKSYEFRIKRVELMRDSYEVMPENFARYLNNAADMALRSGRSEQAFQLYQESLQFYRDQVSASERYQYQTLLKLVMLKLVNNDLIQAKSYLNEANSFSDEIKTVSTKSQRMARIIHVFINALEQNSQLNHIEQACPAEVIKYKHFYYYCQIIKTIHAKNNNDMETALLLIEQMEEVASSQPDDYLTFKQKIIAIKQTIK